MDIPAGTSPVNIRSLSVRCGNCDSYQTLSHFYPHPEWNVYTFVCENGSCDPEVTKTFVEVPAAIDEFANRDPEWRGGGRHGESEEEAS